MKFFAVFNILFTFRIFEQLALALKNRVWPEFTVLNVFFLLQNFEQLALALKNRTCPENFHCIEIRIFWGTCTCSENRVFPEIFHCIEHSFYIQDFWATCACPEKQSVLWDCSLYWICFLHSGFLGNMFSLVSLIHRFVFLLATTRVVCEAPISTSLRRGSTEHEVGQAAIFLVFGMTPRVILLVLVVRAQPTWTTSSRSSHLNVFASMTMLYYAFLMTKLT